MMKLCTKNDINYDEIYTIFHNFKIYTILIYNEILFAGLYWKFAPYAEPVIWKEREEDGEEIGIYYANYNYLF